MKLNDFNHLLDTIKGLSPGQARPLREQLDKQLDTPKPPPAKTAKHTKSNTPKKATLTADEFNQRLSEVGRIASLPGQAPAATTKPLATPRDQTAKRPKSATPSAKRPLSIDEIHRRMMARGLITRLPDPALVIDDDDPADHPVTIKGEPLSETILRERR